MRNKYKLKKKPYRSLKYAKIPSINQFSFYHSTAPTHSYHQTYSTNFLNTLHICLMSFLKTKQLQAVCPLHAPTILPRLLLFCTNHLVEVCTAARAKLPCAQLVKRAALLSEKPPLNCGSHWHKIFLFFLLKLSFGSFCTFFLFCLEISLQVFKYGVCYRGKFSGLSVRSVIRAISAFSAIWNTDTCPASAAQAQ